MMQRPDNRAARAVEWILALAGLALAIAGNLAG